MALALALVTGSAAAAAGQSDDAEVDLMATSYVTGTLGEPSDVTEGVFTVVDGVRERRGWVFGDLTLESDDPRLSGSLTVMANGDERIVPGTSERVDLRSLDYQVRNELGGWSGPATRFFHLVAGQATVDLVTALLVGEDAYDGLSAYLMIDSMQTPPAVTGTVFAGEISPAPGAPEAE
jgi:hypothetical protein